jgi:hypothetical protein
MTHQPNPPRGNPVAVAALGAAIVTGISADLLLRTSELIGINIWILSLVLQVQLVLLYRRYHTAIPWTSLALLFGSGSFLLSFAWRDSPALNAMSLAAAVATAGLAAWVAQGASLQRSTTMQYIQGVGRSAAGAMVGILPLALHDADWRPFNSTLGGTGAARVGRGLALAVPPVILFGALFAAADPIFGAFYSRLFQFDMETLVQHCVIIGFVGWAVAGFLRDMVIPGIHHEKAPVISPGRLAFTESIVVLGSVTLVFLLFVAIQVRTLFGGDAFVLTETGLTYAEYARQGFFHMVWAAALVLPMLLLLEWATRRESLSEQRNFRALALLLLALLGVVLLSALHRMRIYQASYGLTELRVYTVAFMAWLAPVLAWFALSVLAGRRERFMPGALSLGLVTILTLHLVNPDQLIARTNLERMMEGRQFDIRHAVSLSDDAMPDMLRSLDSFTPEARCLLLTRLERKPGDWRSWNLSRSRVEGMLGDMKQTIGRYKASCPTTPTS